MPSHFFICGVATYGTRNRSGRSRKIGNRFDLVLVAARRARQMQVGGKIRWFRKRTINLPLSHCAKSKKVWSPIRF